MACVFKRLLSLPNNKQSCITDVLSIGFFYTTLQHGSQHTYQLTSCQILLIHYTVDRSSAASLLTFDRSPHMTL